MVLKVVPGLDDLRNHPELAQDLPVDALPAMLGDLERVKATLWTRLTMPQHYGQPEHPSGPDAMNAKETARRMGVSLDYVFKHAAEFPFAWKQSRRWVFSAQGLAQYQEEQRRKKAKERT